MPLSQALPDKPRKPFRGAVANLTAYFLIRPMHMRLLLQYVLPPFQRPIDLGPTVFVSTHRSVSEVMERDDDFPIGPQVGPAMVCGTFVLGTDRVPLYREDLALLWESFYGIKQDQLPAGGRRNDLPQRFGPFFRYTEAKVNSIIKEAITRRPPPASGRSLAAMKARIKAGIHTITRRKKTIEFDLVQEVFRPICVDIIEKQLGVGPPDDDWAARERKNKEWTNVLWEVLESVALRIILPGNVHLSDSWDPVAAHLNWAGTALRASINKAIDKAKEGPTDDPNVIARMYGVLDKKSPKLTEKEIRDTISRNIAGLAITGCHPVAKAAAQAVDILLSNPLAFDGAAKAARKAAQTGDERDKDLFWDFIYEALRFFPPFPVVTRACPRDTVLDADEGNPRKFQRGQTVVVGLLPAMFDEQAVPFPHQFRTDRAPGDSMVFGRGMHACFGYEFARGVLVAMLMPLFANGFDPIEDRKGRRLRNGKLYFDLLVPKSLLVTLSSGHGAK